MAWIELHQTLPTHRKTLAAADMVDMEPVHFIGHLVSFWLWALDNIPDGNLDGVSAKMIARAAQWTGDPQVFVDTLVKAGFIETNGGSLHIHDWHDYAGKLVDKRIEERDRARVRRATKKPTGKTPPTDGQPAVDHSTSIVRPADVLRTTDGQPADDQEKYIGTVPYRTLPRVPSGDDDIGARACEGNDRENESAGLTRFIADEFIPGISAYQLHKLTAWVDEGMTPGVVRWAVEQAMMANVRRVDYVHAILKNLADEGITTREAAETASASRRKAKAGKPAPKAEPEPAPEIVNLVETGPPEPVPLSPEWGPFLEDLKKKGEEKRREQLRRQYRGLENAGNDSG